VSDLFLAPAVGLMNRLRFTGKFAVVVLVLLVAVGTLVAMLYMRLDEAIVHSRSELQGLKVVQPLLRSVQMVQQHRGLSAAVLGGKQESAAAQAEKTREVSEQLTKSESLLPDAMRASPEWQAIQKDWARLAGAAVVGAFGFVARLPRRAALAWLLAMASHRHARKTRVGFILVLLVDNLNGSIFQSGYWACRVRIRA